MKKYQRQKIVKRSDNKKKTLLLVLAGTVLLLAAFIALEKTHTINVIPASHHDTAGTPNDSGINFKPPTKEEKQAGNDQKEEIVEEKQQQATTPPPTPSNKKSVKPAIVSIASDNGQIDVRGFVPGVFEEGGICTAQFTKPGSSTVTKTTTGFGDFNKTTCPPFTFPASELGAGDWSVTLTYRSAAAEGTSDASQVKVQ